MPYEVARAYDEDKNLVPLYVLYDGEVPEVSPGFDVVSARGSSTSNTVYYDISITTSSSNPTGGSVESSNLVTIGNYNYTCQITVHNTTTFNLIVTLGIAEYSASFSIKTENPSTISAGGTATFTGNSSTSSSNEGRFVLNIQRIRS